MTDTEDKVVVLSDIRGKKTHKLLDGVENTPPIEPDLDLRGKELHFFCSLFGSAERDQDHLRIIIHDVTAGYANPIAALSLTRLQWEKLKAEGDAQLAYADIAQGSMSS